MRFTGSHSTPQSIISLFLSKLGVQLSTSYLFKVSSSSTSLRFAQSPLNISAPFTHSLIPPPPPLFFCMLCFFPLFFSSSQALLCLLFPSLMIIHLHLSLLHSKPLCICKAANGSPLPPFKKRECSKKTFMFTGTSQPFLSLHSCSGK